MTIIRSGANALKRLAKRDPAVFSVLRRTRMAIGGVAGARHVPGIMGRVHHNDLMLVGDTPEHYVSVGREVVAHIERALDGLGMTWANAQPALEIGSNYGRVVRELLRHIPASQMHVSDIIAEAAQFCAREFGVTAWPEISHPDFAPREPFKLIVLISVFTHLPDREIARMLRVIERHLAPGGMLVFSTHGFEAAKRIPGGDHASQADVIGAAMSAGGSHYIRSEHWAGDVGTSWHHPDRVRAIVADATALVEMGFDAAGLDRHQDVFAYHRANTAGVSS